MDNYIYLRVKIFNKEITKRYMFNILQTLSKYAFTAFGCVIGILNPTFPFALICMFALLLDSLSAWRLAKRVKKNHPDLPDEAIHDKFESEKAWKMFPTLLIVYGCIVLGHLIDNIIFPFVTMYLANMIAGGFCLYSLWSVLENESSENGKSWALFLQKFMVNKATRHIEGFKEALEEIK